MISVKVNVSWLFKPLLILPVILGLSGSSLGGAGDGLSEIARYLPVRTTSDTQPQALAGDKNSRRSPANEPLCGPYCLFAVFDYFGVPVDMRDLIQPKYISSPSGSSVAELIKAANDHGLHAVPLTNLDRSFLERSPGPAILHVRSSMLSDTYDHFVVFFGIRNGKAVILDPPNVEEMDMSELLPLWDGVAIVVSRDKIDKTALLLPGYLRILSYAGLCLPVFLSYHYYRRRIILNRPGTPRNVRRFAAAASLEAGLILAVASLAAISYHAFSTAGLLNNSVVVKQLQAARIGKFIPKLDRSDVKFAVEQKGARLIDARFPLDFQAGHIPDSINLPVSASDDEITSRVNAVTLNTPLIIYCQSRGCKFAEDIASRLLQRGYTDIRIYRDGWVDWAAHI